MKEEADIGKLIYDETESRLAEMAKADYETEPIGHFGLALPCAPF